MPAIATRPRRHGLGSQRPPRPRLPCLRDEEHDAHRRADAIANAAGVAHAVFPATMPENRPGAVALIDARDWRAGDRRLDPRLHARARCRSCSPTVPSAARHRDALAALRPLGAKAAGGAQVVRVGDVARPPGLRTTDIAGRDPFALARALDAFQTAARGKSSDRVIVVSADDPAFAMPAAAWAAKAGDPVLFVHRTSVPQETKAALLAHDQPASTSSGRRRLSAPASRPRARSSARSRAWRRQPHRQRHRLRPLQRPDLRLGRDRSRPRPRLRALRATRSTPAAASPRSVNGSDGPLLLLASAIGLDGAVGQYLLDIQPGYTRDPVRGVYNHGWIVGDDRTISVATQARIDSLLEIKKAQTTQAPSSSP